jgi:cell division septation protein DedD
LSDHDPSYYEIALTNRQVMVAFVILLSCLLGTFFAGVWVGRSEAETGEAAAAERRAENDTGVEELDFFAGGDLGESDQRDAPAEGLPDPAAARAEREARQPVAAPGSVPPAATPSPPADPRPAPRTGGEDLAGGEGPALDEQAPPAAAAPAPERRVAAGGLVIQVFSSRDREQAERVVERLRNGGERPVLSPVEVGGQTMYRVRLGPFADRQEADRVAERVRRGFGLETWITSS